MAAALLKQTKWAVSLLLVIAVTFGISGFLLGKLFANRGANEAAQKEGKNTAHDASKLKNPMIRALIESLDESNGIQEQEKREARNILLEADEKLAKIKEENRRAIEKVNRPPTIRRRHPPQKSDKKDKEEKAEKDNYKDKTIEGK